MSSSRPDHARHPHTDSLSTIPHRELIISGDPATAAASSEVSLLDHGLALYTFRSNARETKTEVWKNRSEYVASYVSHLSGPTIERDGEAKVKVANWIVEADASTYVMARPAARRRLNRLQAPVQLSREHAAHAVRVRRREVHVVRARERHDRAPTSSSRATDADGAQCYQGLHPVAWYMHGGKHHEPAGLVLADVLGRGRTQDDVVLSWLVLAYRGTAHASKGHVAGTIAHDLGLGFLKAPVAALWGPR
jgi:hypothetical protein